ncbi:hypothetical protein BC830DRAFT_297683 [Chytriomyces sp. MP71]|nr:hypothetical protein BC830DRAFT_297683 [Chytriomyces sp. MP71]
MVQERIDPWMKVAERIGREGEARRLVLNFEFTHLGIPDILLMLVHLTEVLSFNHSILTHSARAHPCASLRRNLVKLKLSVNAITRRRMEAGAESGGDEDRSRETFVEDDDDEEMARHLVRGGWTEGVTVGRMPSSDLWGSLPCLLDRGRKGGTECKCLPWPATASLLL